MKQAKLLNAQEFKRLAAVIDSKRHAVRNHTVVALSFYAGLRACEIAGLHVGNVYEANGTVRDSFYLQAEQTKGGEGSTVLVNKKLAAALKRYAERYPKHCGKPDAALIFSGKGGGFSAQTIVNLFAVLYEAAGITGASSHSGRRQFVTSMAEKGINPRVIQLLVRHRSLQTTMVYIDAGEAKLRKAIEMVEI
ncbi:integrase [Gemmobacter aquarius]|uniref:Integrase n=1 Tax=Paragemmobacter aquarius TaxID=2169400 RepID=A0A2S0UJ80_9RHOB|nr:site-specific integrase [Gemmobacter aquarius]AWB47883.1 integrase [Gemmobacter aquarius]